MDNNVQFTVIDLSNTLEDVKLLKLPDAKTERLKKSAVKHLETGLRQLQRLEWMLQKEVNNNNGKSV